MAKPEQVLIIEPQRELRFRGPFTGTSVTSYIKLINPTNCKVYFKIKTTAPKRYCVRPNAGFLKPKQGIQIAVTLQPFDFDPTEKDKHKFMVQTLVANNEDDEEYHDVWKDTNRGQLMDSKLKCVFEIPVTNPTTTKTTTTTTTTKSEGNTTNDKNKGEGDPFKLLIPKTLDDNEEKLIKAAHEVKLLRVEESNLRQENLQLKEDLLKLRNAACSDANIVGGRNLAGDFTSQNSSQLFPTSTSVIIAIAMVIVGYLLGKMI